MKNAGKDTECLGMVNPIGRPLNDACRLDVWHRLLNEVIPAQADTRAKPD